MKPYIVNDGQAYYLCVPGSKMIHIPNVVTLQAVESMLAGKGIGNYAGVQAVEALWVKIPV